MNKPYIDIILLSYGNFATTTKNCLDSLLPDSSNVNFRLTVIDNCSPDNSANEIREYLKDQPQVLTVFLEQNLGFGGGMNYGAAMAQGEWLLLVNSDTIFAPGALVTLFHALQIQPSDVGMVGPVTNAAGNGQEYNFRGSVNEILNEARVLQNLPCKTLIPCYRLDFFCVAIRRSLWVKLNGLDPIFGLGYYEDTDFSMRAKNEGCRMLICEDAFVFHVGGSSFSKNPNTRELIKRNKRLFIIRHPNAELLHKREGNLAAIIEFCQLHKTGTWNNALFLRLKYRMNALFSDLPRGFLKRWLWKKRIQKTLIKCNIVNIIQ